MIRKRPFDFYWGGAEGIFVPVYFFIWDSITYYVIFNNVVRSQAITHFAVTRDSVRMEQKGVIYSSELPQSSYKLSGSTLVLIFIRFPHNSTKLTFFWPLEIIYILKKRIFLMTGLV